MSIPRVLNAVRYAAARWVEGGQQQVRAAVDATAAAVAGAAGKIAAAQRAACGDAPAIGSMHEKRLHAQSQQRLLARAKRLTPQLSRLAKRLSLAVQSVAASAAVQAAAAAAASLCPVDGCRSGALGQGFKSTVNQP